MATQTYNETTGMQLRSGNVYTATTQTLTGLEFDGADYISMAHLRGFNWEWAQNVHKGLSETKNWEPESAYQFVQYLASTSGHWCEKSWSQEATEETREFGKFLMSTVQHFKDSATQCLKYPNTRSADTWKSEYFGLWQGTVRLATEIESEWNVCEFMSKKEQNNDNIFDTDEEDLHAQVAPMEEEVDYESQAGYGHA